jgi:hypothetical protein
MKQWITRHRALTLMIGALAVGGAAFALAWFQPHKLFFDERVDEALPGIATEAPAAAAPGSTTSTTTVPATTAPSEPEIGTVTPVPPKAPTPTTTTPTTTTTAAPAGPAVLHESTFIDVGHTGTGRVLVVELEDGSRVVRFEDLDVENGPDLRVILSRSPLVDDRNAYDDGDFVDLGVLKGNQGNQNYEIPDGVDLDEFLTVAIWCRRFNYTFNAAAIR